MAQPTLEGIRKAGNAGIAGVVTTGAVANGTLLHDMPTGRTCRITKIIAYNDTGADLTLLFGTRDLAVAPAFVQLLPDLFALDTFDNVWTEDDIPRVEFAADTSALAAGRLGDVYVVAGTVAVPVAGVIIQIEVEEYGA